MIKTFKTKIYPTKNQREMFNKSFGIRRFVWNWCLNEYLESLKIEGQKPKTAFDLQKQLNNTLAKQEEYNWLNEVNTMIRQESIKDLGLSIKRYHEEQIKARKTAEVINTEKFKPRFKSKKRDINSFRIVKKNDSVFKIFSKKKFSFTWTRSYGRMIVKLAESINFLKECDIKTMSIKYDAGNYYIYITYEKDNQKLKCKCNSDKAIGIDMGMKTPLTCVDSNNRVIKYHQPDKLYKVEKHTEKIHKKLSRKKYGSNNYNKYKKLLQKSYMKENNIKREFRELITTFLCKNYKIIKIEDFNTKVNTLRNINRALSRLGKYEFIERLKQKSELYDNDLKSIKGLPTTQTCSKCGHRYIRVEKLTLKDRVFICKSCGYTEDRDINSARNILAI